MQMQKQMTKAQLDKLNSSMKRQKCKGEEIIDSLKKEFKTITDSFNEE